MALLVDIGAASDCACSDALEHLFKSMAVDPTGGLERSMWAPHPVPLLRPLVEAFTRQLQLRLEGLQDALARALTGEPIGTLAKAEPAWARMDGAAMAEARARLEAKDPATYSLEDWLELVELLFQQYLPRDYALTMADWLATRAQLAAKIQAAMDRDTGAWKIPVDHLAELLPNKAFGLLPRTVLTPLELSVLTIARQRAALHISDVTASTRSRIQGIVVDHVQAILLGQRQGTTAHLKTALFDAFGTLNRDFRRIAVTEAGEAQGQGFIAATAHGQRVRRLEAYQGACDWCRSINGKVFTVVDPAAPEKNGDTEVWVGKTNVGRSASPRKRVGGELIDRESEELWWVASGTQHPHCRGNWIAVLDDKPRPGVDPAFYRWMVDTLDEAVPAAKKDRRPRAE